MHNKLTRPFFWHHVSYVAFEEVCCWFKSVRENSAIPVKSFMHRALKVWGCELVVRNCTSYSFVVASGSFQRSNFEVSGQLQMMEDCVLTAGPTCGHRNSEPIDMHSWLSW